MSRDQVIHFVGCEVAHVHPAQREVQARGLLELLDGVGGRVMVRPATTGPWLASRKAWWSRAVCFGERLERRVAGGVVGQLR